MSFEPFTLDSSVGVIVVVLFSFERCLTSSWGVERREALREVDVGGTIYLCVSRAYVLTCH